MTTQRWKDHSDPLYLAKHEIAILWQEKIHHNKCLYFSN